MTKKDQSTSENIDRNKSENDDCTPQPSGKQDSEETKSSTEIKNAHAAGDGAYGRSDKSIFVGDENKNDEQENDPPY